MERLSPIGTDPQILSKSSCHEAAWLKPGVKKLITRKKQINV